MRRALLRIVIATVLVASGWIAGSAQRAEPDFELVVTAPSGSTSVECRRGCDLAWIERGINPNSKPIPTFTFFCSSGTTCSSARIGGWIRSSGP